MTEIPGLGPKKALAIYKEQGIDSIEELRAALEGGRLDDVKGFGPKTRENILRGIDRMSQASGRALLSVAGDLAGYFVDRLSERTDVQRIEIAGSLRRMRETIGDVDLLVASEEPADVMEVFATAGDGRPRPREGRYEVERAHAQRPPGRPAGRAARVVGRRDDLLHRLEGAQHPDPRDGGPEGTEAQRVRPVPGEDRQADRRRDRGGGLRASSACPGSRRRCARTAARSTPRSTGRCRTC